MTKMKTLFLYLDALGLVVFTIIGCQIAQQINLPATIVLLSGMITGCAGGVLRDVLCNEVPLTFPQGDLCKRIDSYRGCLPGDGIS
jgi:uncharacterized membrane protein YeiH